MHPVAVLVLHPVDVFEGVILPGPCFLEERGQVRPVVGMDEAAEFFGGLLVQFLERVAQHFGPAFVDDIRAGLDIPFPDADIGAVDDADKPLLGQFQLGDIDAQTNGADIGCGRVEGPDPPPLRGFVIQRMCLASATQIELVLEPFVAVVVLAYIAHQFVSRRTVPDDFLESRPGHHDFGGVGIEFLVFRVAQHQAVFGIVQHESIGRRFDRRHQLFFGRLCFGQCEIAGLFRPFLFRHVLNEATDALLSRGVFYEKGIDKRVYRVAVLVQSDRFHQGVPAVAHGGRTEMLARVLVVFRWYDPVERLAFQLVFAVTQHFAQGYVCRDDLAAFVIEHRDADRRKPKQRLNQFVMLTLLGLCFASVVDVDRDPIDADRAARVVTHGDAAARTHPDPMAVPVAHPVLERMEIVLARIGRRQFLIRDAKVIGMNEIQPFLVGDVVGFSAGEAQIVAVTLVDPGDASLWKPFPGSHAGAFDQVGDLERVLQTVGDVGIHRNPAPVRRDHLLDLDRPAIGQGEGVDRGFLPLCLKLGEQVGFAAGRVGENSARDRGFHQRFAAGSLGDDVIERREQPLPCVVPQNQAFFLVEHGMTIGEGVDRGGKETARFLGPLLCSFRVLERLFLFFLLPDFLGHLPQYQRRPQLAEPVFDLDSAGGKTNNPVFPGFVLDGDVTGAKTRFAVEAVKDRLDLGKNRFGEDFGDGASPQWPCRHRPAIGEFLRLFRKGSTTADDDDLFLQHPDDTEILTAHARDLIVTTPDFQLERSTRKGFRAGVEVFKVFMRLLVRKRLRILAA